MSIKKKLGLGIGAAALGLSLVGGGTFAYFNDIEETNNTFAAGTLDLALNPTTIIDVANIKPGDKMTRMFELKNTGSLDISQVLLTTAYEVIDAEGDNNGDDFGKHIRVNFLFNDDKNGVQIPETVIFSTMLNDIKGRVPDAVQNKINSLYGWGDEASGMKAGTSDRLFVQFEFLDNKKDQNLFQGDSLELKWTFDAKQTKGSSK